MPATVVSVWAPPVMVVRRAPAATVAIGPALMVAMPAMAPPSSPSFRECFLGVLEAGGCGGPCGPGWFCCGGGPAGGVARGGPWSGPALGGGPCGPPTWPGGAAGGPGGFARGGPLPGPALGGGPGGGPTCGGGPGGLARGGP